MSDDGVALERLGELGGEIAAGAIVMLSFDDIWYLRCEIVVQLV
jgi:hypothetical protein